MLTTQKTERIAPILMNVKREPTIVIEGKELVQTLSDHSNVTVTKDMKAMEFAVSGKTHVPKEHTSVQRTLDVSQSLMTRTIVSVWLATRITRLKRGQTAETEMSVRMVHMAVTRTRPERRARTWWAATSVPVTRDGKAMGSPTVEIETNALMVHICVEERHLVLTHLDLTNVHAPSVTD